MKTTTTSEDLRKRAETLEEYAGRYRSMAVALDREGIAEVKVTGVTTFEKAIDHLGSNTRRLQLQIQKAIDDQR